MRAASKYLERVHMSAMSRTFFLILVFLVSCANAIPPAWGSDRANWAADFNRLSPAARMEAVVAAVSRRAAALRNFTFRASGTDKYYRGRVPATHGYVASSVRFRCIGRRFWLHLQTKVVPSGKYWTNFYSSWNGHVQRSVSYQASFGKVAECVVCSHPFSIRLKAWAYMLGLRANTTIYSTTLTRYLRRSIKNKWQHYRAWAQVNGGRRFLVARVRTGGEHRTWYHYREYWLDVRRGFMITRFVDRYKGLFKLVGKVLRSGRLAGVWVPRAIRVSDVDRATPGLTGVVTYRFSAVAVGSVTPPELALKFPRNSLCLNLIRMRSYFVSKDGKRSSRPLYVPQVGKILNPAALLPAARGIPGRAAGQPPAAGGEGGGGLSFRFTVGHCAAKGGEGFVRRVFPFVNKTGSTVRIDKITTSCPCTTAVASGRNIRPGASGYITARVRLKGLPEEFTRMITVYETVGKSAYPKRQRLTLRVVRTPGR